MIAQLIFSVATVVVLFTVTQLVKKFANGFFTKISNFVPLIIGALAVIAQGVFNLITGTGESVIDKIDIVNSVKFGFLIASSEVYTYEGIYKLIKKGKDFLTKTEKVVEHVQEVTEDTSKKK